MNLKGILRLEHTLVANDQARFRTIFYAVSLLLRKVCCLLLNWRRYSLPFLLTFLTAFACKMLKPHISKVYILIFVQCSPRKVHCFYYSQQPADTTEYPVSEVVVKKKWMKLSEIKMCTLRKPEPLQFAEYISQGWSQFRFKFWYLLKSNQLKIFRYLLD